MQGIYREISINGTLEYMKLAGGEGGGAFKSHCQQLYRICTAMERICLTSIFLGTTISLSAKI